jgi:hypothetical protein
MDGLALYGNKDSRLPSAMVNVATLFASLVVDARCCSAIDDLLEVHRIDWYQHDRYSNAPRGSTFT